MRIVIPRSPTLAAQERPITWIAPTNPVTIAAIRPARIPARYPIATMRPNRRLTWRRSKMRSANSQKTIPFKKKGTSIQIASAIHNQG